VGIDWRAFPELLKVVLNHKRTTRETVFNHQTVAVLRAQLHVVYMYGVICGYRVDLLLALELRNCNLGYQNRAVPDLGLSPYACKLSRPENIPWIGESRRNSDRSSLRIELTIDELDVPVVWISLSVGKRQC
jgi:hypothetical protein